MSEGYKNEAEGYAASLRQQAEWVEMLDPESRHSDFAELAAAADFIERQQAEIEALIHDVERHQAIVTAELSTGPIPINVSGPVMIAGKLYFGADYIVNRNDSHDR